jgi:hypothetical protein
MPCLISLGCCTGTQPKVNFDPSFLDVPEHRLLAYLQGFG